MEVSKVSKPRENDKNAKWKLFNDPQALKAILAFLEATKIGIKPEWEEEEEENLRNLDSWSLEFTDNSDLEEESELKGVG